MCNYENKTVDEMVKVLEAVQGTIRNSDIKASSLLSAVGIIFGLSAFTISELQGKENNIQQLLIYIFGALYVVIFFVLITLLVLIVLPRRKNKKQFLNTELAYKYYGEDIYKAIVSNELNNLLTKSISKETVVDQIKICTKISHTKENLLIASVGLTICFAFCLCSLLTLAFMKI